MGAALLAAWATHLSATTLVLEAEKLEMTGGWREESRLPGARKFLIADTDARGMPAAGALDLPHAGAWRLWVRSKDYPDYQPGSRIFRVRIGAATSDVVFGRHGQRDHDGWAWEDGGTVTLTAGPNLVVLGEEVSSYARCDAILLTDNMGYRPEGPPERLAKQAATLVPLDYRKESREALVAALPGQVAEKAVAVLENAHLRVAFHLATTESATSVVVRLATRDAGAWTPVDHAAASECYWVVARPPLPEMKPARDDVYLSWDTSLAPFVDVRAGTATVRTRPGENTAPWLAGKCTPLRPSSVRQRDAQTVELGFPPTTAGQLVATWHVASERPAAEVSLTLAVTGPGYFSLGYGAPWAMKSSEADFLLLPFMFHGQRFPERVAMLPSALTPTPLSLVNRDGFSCALVGHPEAFAFDWPNATNSRYVFGLRNAAGLAQPLLFSPVIGQQGSLSTGTPVQAKFLFWAQRGDWYASYRRIADDVFQSRDYRRPVNASLSDAALNLFDLLRHEKASGWDARAKGPWNIESRNVVTHSSPLTYLGYYLLTGDEDFYRRLALPSLEFLLSRPGPHFAAEEEIGDNYYRHQTMRGPGSFYGAATHASAFAMTHGRAPAFGDACLATNGTVRITHAGGHVVGFEDALALYRLTGERKWLDEAIAGADAYIAANLTRLPTRDIGSGPFMNVSFVPDWEGLLHLYEATGERRFLAASAEGARWLLTTLWTQPCIPDGERTLHPGGVYDNARHIWWMGDMLYRLGLYEGPATTERVQIPPVPLAEKRVPAWTVSNVGLGLEQPCTYTRRGTPHANILMNTWAPNLLRLAQATGDTAFRTAARNATIGRFANYPGYYLDGFTDQHLRADYPIAGPDVTCLYVHHIVPFAAYVVDYLFTDAEMRSGGAVKFPSTRQCGYVWFDSRMYGHAPGAVYGRQAWPWLHRTAATVDTIDVDRVLAEGDGAFHVALLNQVNEPRAVRVAFDEKALGRPLVRVTAKLRSDNGPATEIEIRNGVAKVAMKAAGFAVLTIEEVHIDVPTHRTVPPATLALPSSSGTRSQPVAGTSLEARGTELMAPPFAVRDLFVYVVAGRDDCRSATLRFRVGAGPEQVRKVDRFPWEFSERIDDVDKPITWTVEAERP